MLANKADCIANVEAELEAFREVTGLRYPLFTGSAITGQGLGERVAQTPELTQMADAVIYRAGLARSRETRRRHENGCIFDTFG